MTTSGTGVMQKIYLGNLQNSNEKSSTYVLGSGQGRKIQNIVEIVFNYFNLSMDKYAHDTSFLRR